MDTEEHLTDVARSARRRLWAADTACYYVQRRFSQTENAKDRLLWQNCQKESEKARVEVQAAEEAIARAEL